MKTKKADILNKAVIHIILVAIMLIAFFFVINESVNSRGVKQQIIEKQTALLIDAAVPGMKFEIAKENLHGTIQAITLEKGTVQVTIDRLTPANGYPYITKYTASVTEEKNHFVITIT